MAGTMIVLQLITPAPSADPLQRKMMAIGMPIVHALRSCGARHLGCYFIGWWETSWVSASSF